MTPTQREAALRLVARVAEQQAECNGLAAGWHIAAEIRGPNVEFSGVPAGNSGNHPAGGTSAGTPG